VRHLHVSCNQNKIFADEAEHMVHYSKSGELVGKGLGAKGKRGTVVVILGFSFQLPAACSEGVVRGGMGREGWGRQQRAG
jgi:hypothetical protein